MKAYEAPELFVDEYVADTMIASSGGGNPKNGNPKNQNCYGCDAYLGQIVGDDMCIYYPGDAGSTDNDPTTMGYNNYCT